MLSKSLLYRYQLFIRKTFYLSKGIFFAFFISLNTYIVRSTEEFKPRKFSPVLYAEKVSAPGANSRFNTAKGKCKSAA